MAAEPKHLAQLAVGDLPDLRETVHATGGDELPVAAELEIEGRALVLFDVELPAVRQPVQLQRPLGVTGDEQLSVGTDVDVDRLRWPGRIVYDAHLFA